MPYDDTRAVEKQPLQRWPVEEDREDRPTEVMGSGGLSQPAPAPAAPPCPSSPPFSSPAEGYGPLPSGAAKTEILYKPPSVLAWLAVKAGPRAGRLYRLSPEVTAIGRDSHNDIIVDDVAVSRQHAKVKLEKGADGQKQFYLYDLATANGTKLNGKPILREALYDGDEIEIGRTILVFKQLDGPRRVAEETPIPHQEEVPAAQQGPEMEGG